MILGDDHVAVHCLCPPIAATNILQSGRNRPADLSDGAKAALSGAEAEAAAAASAAMGQFYTDHGEKPENVVAKLVENVEAGLFYTIMDNTEGFEYGIAEQIAQRMAGQISGHGSLTPDFVNPKMQRYMAGLNVAAAEAEPATASARL